MKELFDFLILNRVTPNGWLVLWSVHKKISYPNYINYMTEQKRLVLSGHLSDSANDLLGKTYTLTPKGQHLIREAESLTQRLKRAKKNEVPFEDWEINLQTYTNLFPVGRPHGQPLRSAPRQLYERFVWFFSEYPEFDWETVFVATGHYVESKINDPGGIKYMKTSAYFVKKQDGSGGKAIVSALADWCMAVKDGSIEEMATGGKKYFESDVV